MNLQARLSPGALEGMAGWRLVLHVEMPSDIPPCAVVELAVVREKTRKFEPAVRIDDRQQGPAEAEVDRSGAVMQGREPGIEGRAAMAENTNSFPNQSPEIDRPIRMGIGLRRQCSCDNLGYRPAAAAVVPGRDDDPARQ